MLKDFRTRLIDSGGSAWLLLILSLQARFNFLSRAGNIATTGLPHKSDFERPA